MLTTFGDKEIQHVGAMNAPEHNESQLRGIFFGNLMDLMVDKRDNTAINYYGTVHVLESMLNFIS